MQRVFDEIRFVKNTRLSRDQMARIRAALLRDFEQNSQDNGYLLESDRPEGRGWRRRQPGQRSSSLPSQIEALTGEAIEQAARTYLNTESYVKVTLMPEAK